MLQKFKALVYLTVFLALIYLGYRVHRLLSRIDAPNIPQAAASLAPTEQEKFMVTENHVTTVKRDKAGKTVVSTEYVPNRAVITVNKDGTVSVKNQRLGLTFQPGLGVGYVDGARVALHAKVVYFDRLGLNTGVSGRLSGTINPRLFLGVSYALLGNTSVMLQYDNKRQIGGYLSVKF